MPKSVTRITGLGQSEPNPQDMYDWYTKLAGWRKQTPQSREEYDKVPLDSWMQMLGFKRTQLTENLMTRRKSFEEAGKLYGNR